MISHISGFESGRFFAQRAQRLTRPLYSLGHWKILPQLLLEKKQPQNGFGTRWLTALFHAIPT